MPNTREKLVELIDQVRVVQTEYGVCISGTRHIADHLIANGVTVADGKDTGVHTGWIPASEPPKVYRDEYGIPIPFLAYTEDENLFVTYLVDGKHWGRFGQDLKVTHWMPVPEPPEEE